MMARPAGNGAEVPKACSTRSDTSHPKDGASGATAPVTVTRASPATSTRRGPNMSASLPISE